MRGPLKDTPAGMRGLTLLELVIAVVVLSIGTMAALRATDQSRLALAGAAPRLLAQVVAQNRAEELRLYGANTGGSLPDQVTMGGQVFGVKVDYATTAAGLIEARISARAVTGEGAVLVAVLPAPAALP